MNSKRVLTAIAAGAALTLGGVATATSSDAAVAKDSPNVVHPNWCFGGYQAGDGTDISVTIDRCTDVVTAVQARLDDGAGLPGHFEFWGPNGWHINSPDQDWGNEQWTPNYSGPGQTVTGNVVCTRFWEQVPGGYVPIGGITCWTN
jgi:hypothetical protein